MFGQIKASDPGMEPLSPEPPLPRSLMANEKLSDYIRDSLEALDAASRKSTPTVVQDNSTTPAIKSNGEHASVHLKTNSASKEGNHELNGSDRNGFYRNAKLTQTPYYTPSKRDTSMDYNRSMDEDPLVSLSPYATTTAMYDRAKYPQMLLSAHSVSQSQLIHRTFYEDAMAELNAAERTKRTLSDKVRELEWQIHALEKNNLTLTMERDKYVHYCHMGVD